MRKSLIGAVFSVMLALGYLVVTPVLLSDAPPASAAPCTLAPNGVIPDQQACNECMDKYGYIICEGLNTPTAVAPIPPPTQAAPPMPNPFEQPKNGCMVQGPGNLLKECPNYTCANILDDQIREQCMSLPPGAQQEILNIVGQENPTGLYPTPLTAAGTPPPPPDTDTPGPCGSNSLCKSLVGIFTYASGLIGKDPSNPEPIQGGCCGIRG